MPTTRPDPAPLAAPAAAARPGNRRAAGGAVALRWLGGERATGRPGRCPEWRHSRASGRRGERPGGPHEAGRAWWSPSGGRRRGRGAHGRCDEHRPVPAALRTRWARPPAGGPVRRGRQRHFCRALEHAGLGRSLSPAGMEMLGFFVSVVDLEDELIRAVGPDSSAAMRGCWSTRSSPATPRGRWPEHSPTCERGSADEFQPPWWSNRAEATHQPRRQR